MREGFAISHCDELGGLMWNSRLPFVSVTPEEIILADDGEFCGNASFPDLA